MSKDYKLAALSGFLTGICLIPILMNIEYLDKVPLSRNTILVAVPFVSMIGIMFGVWLGRFLSGVLPVMFQISKFAAVGILNTVINSAVINIFSLMSGKTSGISVGEYNIPATIVAATNSYFWNKYWVFAGSNQGAIQDVPKFVIVTVLALVVRSGVIVGMTTYVSHGSIAAGAWLNISIVVATAVGILVDFLGYKFIVFRKK